MICYRCGEETEQSYITHDDRVICYDCYCDNYFTCPDCGEIFSFDEGYYCEDNDDYYCGNCYEAHQNSPIVDYHCTSPFEYNLNSLRPDETSIYLGFELEIENTTNEYCNEDIAQGLKDRLKVQCSHDGSLNNGFEIVSHPCTYECHKSIAPKYKQALNYLINNGMRGDETSTCGLHVHVSRGPLKEDTPIKIALFLENFKEEMCQFARRGSGHYTSFLSDYSNLQGEKYLKSLTVIKKKYPATRYLALNLTNRDTIEFRLFKSTLNYETFMATLNFVDNLVKVCDSTPTSKITWSRVINYNLGDELKAYLIRRNILKSHNKMVNLDRLYNKEVKSIEKLRNKIEKTTVEIIGKMYSSHLKGKNINECLSNARDYSNIVYYVREELLRLKHYDKENTIIEQLRCLGKCMYNDDGIRIVARKIFREVYSKLFVEEV